VFAKSCDTLILRLQNAVKFQQLFQKLASLGKNVES
jgi:hypothetical protein